MQSVVGLFDLIGVSAFSALCILLVRGNSDSQLLNSYLGWIPWFDTSNLPLVLAVLAPSALLSKTLFSFVLNKKILKYLSRLQTDVSSALYSEVLSWPPRKLQAKSRQSLETTIIDGVSGLCVSVIGYSILAFSEFFLLIALLLPIVFIAPPTTLATIFLVLLLFTYLFKLIGDAAQNSGKEHQESYFFARDFVRVSGELSKEIRARGNAGVFLDLFRSKVSRAAIANAKDFHIQQTPKYAMEFVFLLLGVVLGIGFLGSNNVGLGKSVGLISFLMVAGFRILPSYLRLQGSLIIVRKGIGQSRSLLDSLASGELNGTYREPSTKINSSNPPEVRIESISYAYSDSEREIISEFSMTIHQGEKIAIRGPSGIGKSTLVDLILGVIEPTSGSIKFVNIEKNFSASFMSQHTTLIRGTLSENIALGFNQPDEFEVLRLFKELHLDEVFDSHKKPNEIQLDHQGSGISGGELQRIGLARALYHNPSLIVLDEPTSALDIESQMIISAVLAKLSNVTLLIVAHTSWPEEICDRIITFSQSGEISVSAGKNSSRTTG
jgi:ABC-type transport system involved in cytochrome bd biosynthesis fused ATPase/permease subunit